jgi:hypothetical protein
MDEARIDAAIAAEERELLRQIAQEPGYFAQVGGLFTGRTAWVNLLLLVVQTALFIASVYAAVAFFGADDPLTALRWGLPAATLLLMAVIVKIAFLPIMHINRVERTLARLATLIALDRDRANGTHD